MEKRIVVVSGPSGVGKSSIIKALSKALPNVTIGKSITTRPPRSGDARETDDLEYIHVTEEQFTDYIHEQKLLEWKWHPYNGNFYGAVRPEITPEELQEKRGFLLFNVDSEGQKALRSFYEGTGLYTSVYLLGSFETLRDRMRARGETEESIQARLTDAQDRIGECFGYDHIVLTDNRPLEEVVKDIQQIVFDPYNVPPIIPSRKEFDAVLSSFLRYENL